MTTQLIIKEKKDLPNGQFATVVFIWEKGIYENQVFIKNDLKFAKIAAFNFIKADLCKKLNRLYLNRKKAYELSSGLNIEKANCLNKILSFSQLGVKFTYNKFLHKLEELLPSIYVILPYKENNQTKFYSLLKMFLEQESKNINACNNA